MSGNGSGSGAAPEVMQPRHRPGPVPASRPGFRPDIEGLRALAIGLVLLYHAGADRLAGGYAGVDVFFVISGFLITGLLVRELGRTGRVSLTGFYARRMRRLLPSALTVLAAVVLAAWLLVPPADLRGVFLDVVAAALYAVNWRQAAEAVDYSALGTAASPVQHFWSLAVEEQFYVVWPLLLIAVAWWCRRRGRDVRPRLALVLAVTAAVSFWYAVTLTRQAAGAAYFSTGTRYWELAAGGLLALVPGGWWRRVPRWAAGAAGLAGVAGIGGAALRFGEDTAFPGPWALLPVLGAAAVIAAGAVAVDTPAGRLLSLAPVRYVGRVSYSWYLWHWPFLAFTAVWLGEPPLSVALLAVALSWIPAALTHRYVENRFRHAPERAVRPHRSGLVLGAACTAGAVLCGAVSWTAVPGTRLAEAADAPGAAVLSAGDTDLQRSADALRPLPETAEDDVDAAHDDCLVDQLDSALASGCVYGDTSSDTTVVLFGDSHAVQWTPALTAIAERRGWRLEVLTKSACSPAEVTMWATQLKRAYTECDTWRESALRRIAAEEPALVVTGARATTPVSSDGQRLGETAGAELTEEGYAKTLRRLTGAGARVLAFADNPHPGQDVPSCVSGAMDSLADCATAKSDALGFEQVGEVAAREVGGASVIDATSMLCRGGECPAVIGSVVVYRNDDHLTATYVRTMTQWLGGELPVAV
ncbi:acyltransferase family protein [Streptomyces sp. NPDC023723]|uniref:acyltransferase family protein n=1 Tax=Streptomyces sp. NPDC023723 TaxID=3154323 RepID=UPI0033C51C5F